MAIKTINIANPHKTAFIVWCINEYSTQNRISAKKTSDIFKKYHVYDFLNMTYEIEKTRDDQQIMENINKVIKKFKNQLGLS